MKKLQYIIKSFWVDKRENLRITLFSAVIAFVGLFFIANIKDIKSNIVIFNQADDVYFFSLYKADVKEKELKSKMNKKIGKVHSVPFVSVGVNKEYAECYIYDDYIMKHLNYQFASGREIRTDNEVIITSELGKKYKVGNTFLLSGIDEKGNSVEKEKKVCGILENDIIYYPHGAGAINYDMLVVHAGKDLYYKNGVITLDNSYIGSYVMGLGTYMIEPKEEFRFQQIEQQLEDIGELYSGKELIETNLETLQYDTNQKKVFVIAGVSLGLSVFLGSIYISIMRRKKEFGVMMLSGATFISSIVLMRMNGLISTCIGTILGEIGAIYLIKNENLTGELHISFVLQVFFAITILYVFCCAVIQWIWNRNDIIDLITKE